MKTPLWKPLYDNPSLLIHPIDLLQCHRESRHLTLTVFLEVVSSSCCPQNAELHTTNSGNTRRPMVWHMTAHDVTRRPFTCHLALPDDPVTSQVRCDRFDCEQSNAIIILLIQLGGGAILLCLRRTVVFLSSQWQYILARSIRFLFSWTHGYPKTYQCIKSFTVASLMTLCKLCLYATPQW